MATSTVRLFLILPRTPILLEILTSDLSTCCLKWVIPEKIHTATTEGMLENLTGGGLTAVEIHTGGLPVSRGLSRRGKNEKKAEISESAVRRDLRFFVLIREKTRKSNHMQMPLQRQHFLLNI